MNTTQQTVIAHGHSWIMHPTLLYMVKACSLGIQYIACSCEPAQ